jgi:hypothetical protein
MVFMVIKTRIREVPMGMSDLSDDSEYLESNIDEYDQNMDNLSDDEFYAHTLFDEYQEHIPDDDDHLPSDGEAETGTRWIEEEMNDYDELED